MEIDFRQMLFGVGSTAVQSLRSGNPTTDSYAQAAARLLQHAGKWSAVSQSGVRCTTRQRTPIGTTEICRAPGIGACVVCDQPTCFNHSMISPHDGTQICFGCVGRSQQQYRAGGPAEAPGVSDAEKKADCLIVLGLAGEVTWAQVQAVYKAIAKEQHPDKFPPAQRKEQEKKFKKINQAYEWLKAHYEKEAA